jgi:hypothetical protein
MARDAGRVVTLAKKAKKPITVAKARFDIPAGASLDVKAKITAKGKKIVKKRKPIYVTLTINGTEIPAGAITLAP